MTPDAPLTHISNYTIESILGEGAMGVVYRARDPLGNTFAIKTIRRAAPADAEGFQLCERFKREGMAGSALAHPNVVKVHAYGEEGDFAYLVMDFVAGESLKALTARKGRWPLFEALDLAYQLLEALDYFHTRGIVHRDIKPGNIMVDTHHHLVVTDFGIARTNNSTLTQVGTVLGTPWYMSPEQITEQPIDGRSDLFSVGIILYELLTGINPFKADQIMTILDKIVIEPHPLPSSLLPGLPPAIDRLFDRALAKKPADRFQNGSEFRAALQQMLDEVLPDRNNREGWKKPKRAKPHAGAMTAESPPAAPHQFSSDSAALAGTDSAIDTLLQRRPPRSRAVGLLIAAAIVTGILGLIFSSAMNSPPGNERPPARPLPVVRAVPQATEAPPRGTPIAATAEPAPASSDEDERTVAAIQRQCASQSLERILIPEINGIVRCEKTPLCELDAAGIRELHQRLSALHASTQATNPAEANAILADARCTSSLLRQ